MSSDDRMNSKTMRGMSTGMPDSMMASAAGSTLTGCILATSRERPLGAVTLVSTVAASLPRRRRQYEVRHRSSGRIQRFS
jgi:hypothetical protein